MANKIIRSIRFSEEIYNLIEQQPGDSFTGKFENLVRRCVEELPQKERELAMIQEMIQWERKRLDTIRQDAGILDNSIRTMQNTLSSYQRDIKRGADRLQNLLEV